MGKVTRKRYAAEFKSRVALEAIRGELASKHGGGLLAERDFARCLCSVGREQRRQMSAMLLKSVTNDAKFGTVK
ncbi:hypothetical protein AA12717_1926 [Gluconacetobacter sacchari DSM 12717]|uniref:Transposase n=1 Tax=Gluconacetobacter sacchari DSM 12717 TaxID=1307940 RepID=A0ABQ0PA64_9PROT|nr:hypothetical protein AA12717_1926 [Gluconacetobacter sacchari DSM 12717]